MLIIFMFDNYYRANAMLDVFLLFFTLDYQNIPCFFICGYGDIKSQPILLR